LEPTPRDELGTTQLELIPQSHRHPYLHPTLEALTLLVFSTFFLFYGLIPIFGGDGLGLVGADEPRYAQVAREMLMRHDYITPILYGRPWLEKPALFYWRAMFSFREFGVHDWTARFPSASFALALVFLIYLHIRRFRKGGELDAALITATCVGIVAFARGASTDMQLAAPFCIGMLGWYAWYETDKKFWLFDLYFFNAAATLAKGPVAPFLAFCIILTFATLRREWSLLRRTIWWPGIALYLAIVLPWYIAVTRRNPDFIRVFFFQHNLERFTTNRYEHDQPLWYYLAVALFALLPWTVISLRALVDAIRESINEWRARRAKYHYVGHERFGDAFPEFLVLWAIFPIFFFSLSRSKLPGYILPSIPPLTILTGDYLNRIRSRGLQPRLLGMHALLTGVTVALVLVIPWHIVHRDDLPPAGTIIAACSCGLATMLLILFMVSKFGVTRLRIATILPMALLLFFIFGVGPFWKIPEMPRSKTNIQLIDYAFSARPLARILDQFARPGEPVAVFRVRRDAEFGLSFYRNHRVLDYEQVSDRGGDRTTSEPPSIHVPDEGHILVIRDTAQDELGTLLAGRNYEPLFAYPAQRLSIYRVDPKLGPSSEPKTPPALIPSKTMP
jgi:4-amino-4-deoxy-L-arabinose transferase-like glycosyltransferase